MFKKNLEDYQEFECMGGSLDGCLRMQFHLDSFTTSTGCFAPIGKIETYRLADIDGKTYWVEEELLKKLKGK